MTSKRKVRTRIRIFGLAACMLAVTAAAAAQVAIDTERSQLTVHVSRAGLFSAFGHNHEVAAPLAAGTLDADARRIELRWDARRLKVFDPEVSDADRAEIQATMAGEKVLDVARYPDITFISRRVAPSGNKFTVEGELTLHGVTRVLTVSVSPANQRYVGSARLKQTDFGIKPVTAAGGTVKVKDEVQITFEIVPASHRSQ